jgi:hypothetical protein
MTGPLCSSRDLESDSRRPGNPPFTDSTFSSNALALAFLSLIIAAVAAAQERVSFPADDGGLKGGTPTTITGYLHKPARSGPFAAVVSMPGCDGVLGESDDALGKKGEIHQLYAQWGEILSRAGYVVLLIDSFRSRGQNNLCGNSGVGLLRDMPRDAVGGMNYLRSRADVRPDSITIMGQSTAVLRRCSRCPKASWRTVQHCRKRPKMISVLRSCFIQEAVHF